MFRPCRGDVEFGSLVIEPLFDTKCDVGEVGETMGQVAKSCTRTVHSKIGMIHSLCHRVGEETVFVTFRANLKRTFWWGHVGESVDSFADVFHQDARSSSSFRRILREQCLKHLCDCVADGKRSLWVEWAMPQDWMPRVDEFLQAA